MQTADLNRRKRYASGISLIEMLIALLVLSFGLLGMAGLQAHSLRNNTSAYHRSQATMLAYDIVDRMRGNRMLAVGNAPWNQTITASAYELPLDAPPTGGGVPGQDLREWLALLAGRLPSGDGEVHCEVDSAVCTVTVQWDDSRGAAEPQQLIYRTEL